MAFPADRSERAVEDWNESQKRLRFWRGCIMLAGSGYGEADGAAALRTGTYPLGDDRDLDLACVELSRAPQAGELRVTARRDLEAGMNRVVSWLESFGGVVVDRLDGK
jgi:hypothetical protein